MAGEYRGISCKSEIFKKTVLSAVEAVLSWNVSKWALAGEKGEKILACVEGNVPKRSKL